MSEFFNLGDRLPQLVDRIVGSYNRDARMRHIDCAFLPSPAEVEELIRKQSKGLLQDLRLFDVYEGQGVPAGKHSLSWALQFNSEERSLSDGDVEPVMRRIIAALERDLAATLRT